MGEILYDENGNRYGADNPIPVTIATAVTDKHVSSAAGLNATSVKNTSGRVVGWQFVNTTASPKYVKLHNVAGVPAAGVNVGTTIVVPANGSTSILFSGGISFPTGIAYTITGGAADADTTAVAMGDIIGDLFFV